MKKLIVIGMFCLTLGCQKTTQEAQSNALATVNDAIISVSQFETSLNLTRSQMPPQADITQVKQNLLQQLIQDQLLLQEAYRRKIDQTREYKEIIWRYRTRELADALRDTIFAMRVALRPDQIDSLLPKVEKRVWAWEIVVNEKARADSIRQALQDGASFAKLAKQYSTAPTVKRNGFLGEIRQSDLFYSRECTKVLLTTEPGEISTPVPVRDFFVIVKVDSVYPPLTLEKSRREVIREQLSRRKRLDHYLALRDSLFKHTADVRNFPAKFARFDSLADSAIVAWIGPDTITFGLFKKYSVGQPLSPEQMSASKRAEKTLDALLEDVFFCREAEKRGYDQNPDFGGRFGIQQQYALKRGLVSIYSADVTVTEDKIKEYYDSHADLYKAQPQAKVRHILVTNERKAFEMWAQLNDGENFYQLARNNSQDRESAARGGELGYIVRGRMPAEFDEIAFNAPPGEISRPVKTTLGYHVIQVMDRGERPAISLDQARMSIRYALETSVVNERMKALSQELRSSAKIVINEDVLANIK